MDTSAAPADRWDLVLPAGVTPLTSGDPVTIGGCPLVGRLGAGGMGRVYLGRDQRGGLVAVKIAHASLAVDEVTRARFKAEADHLARVPAHCTARLLADGTDQTPPHIITEYIAGRSLKDVVEQDGPLPPERLRALAAGVARTLTSIHQAGLVHRDLKPANVLLTSTGPRVIDFGIAQVVPASGGPTGTGMVVGSIGWIAPERLTRHPATPAADVFGWGCLIAYAGTARHPYGAGDADELARRVIFEPPDLDDLDASVRPLVTAALAKAPDDRPSSAGLLARLGPAGSLAEREPPPYRGETTLDRTRSLPDPVVHGTRPRRKARLAALVASALVVGVATAVTLVATGVEESTPRPTHAPAGKPNVPGATEGTAVTSREFRTHEPGTRAADPAATPAHSKRPARKSGQEKEPGHGKKGHGKG